ncbi:hypothetical protein K9N68_19840 [Kovacikia minuta CCNUW1]|uniref:reverse transcriptase domain-containing protein n=1 Tax=Kovacikia minuta TaxID=2931930 RepID=UPI001CCC8CCD|nr:reverse transcriptase domain-containing protein [Kovacikia minuta]UBF23980.1 hypothetical protein K9N68_19840 [Kovacikia minuta CCNUW1]
MDKTLATPYQLMNVSAAKQTEYNFAPLARFAARFRSTAPLTLYGTDAAELRGIDPQRLKFYFTVKSLKEIYNSRFKLNKTQGVDRLNGIQFERQSKQQIKIIHEKCLAGTYKFSPYLELLRSKGRGKLPRVLAVPTVRDRIVLYALKEILIDVFSESIPRDLANTYIYKITDFMRDKNPASVGVFRADIENFYDSIDREKLLAKLNLRIKSNKILTLIERAITSPIVPQGYKKVDLKKYSSVKGIPQGLSISNILAAIYLAELDDFMRSNEGSMSPSE